GQGLGVRRVLFRLAEPRAVPTGGEGTRAGALDGDPPRPFLAFRPPAAPAPGGAVGRGRPPRDPSGERCGTLAASPRSAAAGERAGLECHRARLHGEIDGAVLTGGHAPSALR